MLRCEAILEQNDSSMGVLVCVNGVFIMLSPLFSSEIDSLQQCRRQLCNKFREEQMAYLAAINKQKQLQIAEDKQRRDQSRAAREEQR